MRIDHAGGPHLPLYWALSLTVCLSRRTAVRKWKWPCHGLDVEMERDWPHHESFRPLYPRLLWRSGGGPPPLLPALDTEFRWPVYPGKIKSWNIQNPRHRSRRPRLWDPQESSSFRLQTNRRHWYGHYRCIQPQPSVLVSVLHILSPELILSASDVGQPKATTAAKFVMKRVKGVNVTPYLLCLCIT